MNKKNQSSKRCSFLFHLYRLIYTPKLLVYQSFSLSLSLCQQSYLSRDSACNSLTWRKQRHFKKHSIFYYFLSYFAPIDFQQKSKQFNLQRRERETCVNPKQSKPQVVLLLLNHPMLKNKIKNRNSFYIISSFRISLIYHTTCCIFSMNKCNKCTAILVNHAQANKTTNIQNETYCDHEQILRECAATWSWRSAQSRTDETIDTACLRARSATHCRETDSSSPDCHRHTANKHLVFLSQFFFSSFFFFFFFSLNWSRTSLS